MADPRLLGVESPSQNPPETANYGSLGPGADVKTDRDVVVQNGNWRMMVAILVGVLFVFFFVGSGTVHAAWQEISAFLSLTGKPKPASPAIMSEHETEGLDHSSPQSQAQLLLERAINHYDGAADQIASRVDGWHGKINMTPSLNSLFTTALNSNDLRVRAAAIEVDLAALNVDKSSVSIDRLTTEVDSGDQKAQAWALWTLGLLGNRGVEPDRVEEILKSHVHDSNQNTRYWAVEGMAYLGTDSTIPTLLEIFHDDPAPSIRERAACGLAQSGMFSEQQRRTAIPQLLDFAEDSSLDAQTHGWVYQALRDITGQSLPNDPSAWRNWYNSHQS